VTLFVNTSEPDFLERRGIEVKVVSTPIERRIRLWSDLHALLFLVRAFRSGSFDMVHSVTPKGGLLAMLAGLVAGIPVRIHTFTGQVWGSRSGPMRWLLKAADRVTAWAATHVLADSFSQREFLVSERVVSRDKSGVLAHGSISGVDVERFVPDPAARMRVRKRHGIPDESLVFLFMARLTRDKGALVMAEGFARYVGAGGPGQLLVVGPDEEGLRPRMREILADTKGRVHFEDFTKVPEELMAAADVFCLPSYREGFGTVLIDAAAVGIPAIASRIYGSEEAIQEGRTGLLHEAGNAPELADRMRQLAMDPALRARLGQAAQARARQDFSEAAVTAATLAFYEKVLAASPRG
jgi:glycosyltransferase involved in cell wall biosynthesis